jgi:hypothetical protein
VYPSLTRESSSGQQKQREIRPRESLHAIYLYGAGPHGHARRSRCRPVILLFSFRLCLFVGNSTSSCHTDIRTHTNMACFHVALPCIPTQTFSVYSLTSHVTSPVTGAGASLLLLSFCLASHFFLNLLSCQ